MCSQRYLFHSLIINRNVYAAFVLYLAVVGNFSVFMHVSTPQLTLFFFFFLYVGVCFADIWVCLCMGEWDRIWPVYHLIVIASVFGRETVDRNHPVVEVRGGREGGLLWEGRVSHFPVS